MKRIGFRRVLIGIGILLIISLAGFVIWAATPAGTLMETTVTALESSNTITVTQEQWLAFTPNTPPQTGFIFYPGGRVLPEAYAPILRQISEAGYLVIAPAMPLNLAVFGPNTADEIIAAYPDIGTWVIGGHSLGGAMAAGYARNHLDSIAGLVLWASYPQESDSLAETTLPVVSIYGTRDGLATPDKIEASRVYLPAETVFVSLEGGNHAQFGDYGEQDSDHPAQISRTEQQGQILTATLALLAEVSQ
jgi:pimeloyl-ACP methyl ester carboxylesterase